jgi:tight adherence protein C
VIGALALGMIAGLGAWLIARGLYPAPTPLDAALGILGQPRWPTDTPPDHPQWARLRPVVDATTRLVASRAATSNAFACDLALCERSVQAHAIDKLKTALFAGTLPIGCWTIAFLGGALLPTIPTVIVAIVLGGGGWLIADVQIRQRATARRAEFASALSTYLDLVAILMAGGAGVEQALRDAAAVGEGWSFGLLSRCLSDAHHQSRSPWHAMAATAERMGLASLNELAAAMTLAGESGARVRESLVARASSLRAHEIHDIEAKAAAATEKMGAPVAFLVIGFVALIGYPALATILQL